MKEAILMHQVKEEDCNFLYELMNDKQILTALNEKETSLTDWQNAIYEWQKDTDEENFILFDQEVPMGWISINSLESLTKEAFLKMVVIVPSKQGGGIGTYAIKQIMKYLKDTGMKRISLYTDKVNTTAQKCYTKCGFKISDSLMQTMSNGKMIERYKMSLEISKGSI